MNRVEILKMARELERERKKLYVQALNNRFTQISDYLHLEPHQTTVMRAYLNSTFLDGHDYEKERLSPDITPKFTVDGWV